MTTPTPGRFRKRPVEIDAILWDGTDDTALAVRRWVEDGAVAAIVDTKDIQHLWDHNLGCYIMPTEKTVFAPYGQRCLIVLTLEGEMVANQGDWIIRGVKGEFYPCKPDIFAETYDSVAVGTIESGLISATSTDEAQPITAWVPTTDGDDDRLMTNGLLVDSHKPGYVDIALLNTHDDAWGDHWLVYEAPTETAVRVADAIRQKATEAAAALAEQPATICGDKHLLIGRTPCTEQPGHDGDHRSPEGFTWPNAPAETTPGHETGDMRADPSCTHCRGTGYVHTDDGVDDCRCTDEPDCVACGAPDGGQHDRTCKHGADQ